MEQEIGDTEPRIDMEKENELGVIVKSRKLIEYIFTITEKSPKKFRFTIIAHLQNKALNIMEYLIRANEIYVKDNTHTESCRRRLGYQQETMAELKILGYLAMIAREQECILPKQQEQIAKQISECRKMLWAWMQSDKRRLWG